MNDLGASQAFFSEPPHRFWPRRQIRLKPPPCVDEIKLFSWETHHDRGRFAVSHRYLDILILHLT